MKPAKNDKFVLPDWFPDDPYPLKLCSIKNDDDYVKAIPDPSLRTAVSWYMMGEAYRKALQDVYIALKERDEL